MKYAFLPKISAHNTRYKTVLMSHHRDRSYTYRENVVKSLEYVPARHQLPQHSSSVILSVTKFVITYYMNLITLFCQKYSSFF